MSRWTNEEIEAFHALHPQGRVLAAIVEGEPFASERPGQEARECFPPALRQRFDRDGKPTGERAEPIAADFRAGGDGRTLGLMKLIAGMLDVPLDEVVQREAHRRQRRLTIVAAIAIVGMLVMTSLAALAWQARNEAQHQREQADPWSASCSATCAGGSSRSAGWTCSTPSAAACLAISGQDSGGLSDEASASIFRDRLHLGVDGGHQVVPRDRRGLVDGAEHVPQVIDRHPRDAGGSPQQRVVLLLKPARPTRSAEPSRGSSRPAARCAATSSGSAGCR